MKTIYKGIFISLSILILLGFSFIMVGENSAVENDMAKKEYPAGSILQVRTHTKSIIPSFFFLSPSQDSSHHSPSVPGVEPIPEQEPDGHREVPQTQPPTTSPTWVKMVGAIVNMFLSLYQSL